VTPSSWTFDFHAARDAAEVAEQRVARPELDDLVTIAEPVWKSKFYGAFVLNHRVDLHAIEQASRRWRGGARFSPLDRARTAAPSPRNDYRRDVT